MIHEIENFRRGDPLIQKTVELSGDVANSDDDEPLDSFLPGFAFRVTRVEHFAAAVTAVADYAVRAGGVDVLAGRVAGAPSADGGNTGDGTVTVNAVGADAQVGTYTLTCTAEDDNAGTFELAAPDGSIVADDIEVGSAHTGSGHLDVTIADGDNDWDEDDFVEVVVRAGATPAAETRADASLGPAATLLGADDDALTLHGNADGSGDTTGLRVRVHYEPVGARG